MHGHVRAGGLEARGTGHGARGTVRTAILLAFCTTGCATAPLRQPAARPLPLPAELAAYYSYPHGLSQASTRLMTERVRHREWLVQFPFSAPKGFIPTESLVEFEWFESRRLDRQPAIIFNPIDVAENLKKQGAFIPGVKPGARTAEYIDRVLTRITLPGSMYLAAIALTPFWIFDIFNIQTFFFGGTGLLIVVGVALDTVQQAQQHLLLRHYDGFMKKGRVKVRGRQRYV